MPLANEYCERTEFTVRDGFKVIAKDAAPQEGDLFAATNVPAAVVWLAKKDFDVPIYLILERNV